MSNKPNNTKAIFIAALEKENPQELAEYLDKACANDSKLRAKVEALLLSHKEAGTFLCDPCFSSQATLETVPIQEVPGNSIGRYKLLEKIGEGGMAAVYMAQQVQPLQRRVALKIIKLGMDTEQVIARFEAEKQALAIMDHPQHCKSI